MIARQDIQIRDPFILPVRKDNRYYLYGTTDKEPWAAQGIGFDVYYSDNLNHWNGPFAAFRPQPGFWADKCFWAPEVHEYGNKYYMFASFKADGVCRGTQILVADTPMGPFVPHSNGPVTPHDWDCLDGTLFVDDDGDPWMIFCHEWTQIIDGQMCAMRLSQNLATAVEPPTALFSASQVPWVEKNHPKNGGYVTDGPFMYRTEEGRLIMLWSSFSKNGCYALGIARSLSGNILGPWEHEAHPLYSKDGGHGMLFKTFEEELMLTVHTPNKTPYERPVFIKIKEHNGTLEMENGKTF